MTSLAPAYKNSLNDLDGSEWLKLTKSWFVLNPPKRAVKNLHPATFPDELAEKFIKFFTKKGDWVVDPFCGMASTLASAKRLGRNGIGVELYDYFVEKGNSRLMQIPGKTKVQVIQGDSRFLEDILKSHGISSVNFCLTSPPYWSQLKRKSERQQKRSLNGLKTRYGQDKADLGNIGDYQYFLEEQEQIFDSLYRVMADRSYLVVITNNVYTQGRLWPLAFDTFTSLSKKWMPKDEMIWCQNDKSLRPFGMFHSYIGNRSHHYCLAFRKE